MTSWVGCHHDLGRTRLCQDFAADDGGRGDDVVAANHTITTGAGPGVSPCAALLSATNDERRRHVTATARPTPTTARPTPTTARPTGTYDSGDDGSDDGSTRTVAPGVDARGGGGDGGSDDERDGEARRQGRTRARDSDIMIDSDDLSNPTNPRPRRL